MIVTAGIFVTGADNSGEGTLESVKVTSDHGYVLVRPAGIQTQVTLRSSIGNRNLLEVAINCNV
jgi:hypothetical protein